jgi:ATP-dependent RNA helicase DeaD
MNEITTPDNSPGVSPAAPAPAAPADPSTTGAAAAPGLEALAAGGGAKAAGPLFADLGLRPEVLSALEAMGFQRAMDVQAATIPLVRQRKDLMVQSRTGSGKTAAFGIPFVNDVVDPSLKAVQAIVLLPTRELALQVASELARIAAHLPVTVAPVYGGAPMGRQVEQLRGGAQIVCGTPGRVLDHLRRGSLNLDQVRCAVLDECDEMLSMGFQEDIENILEQTPAARQTLLFSATVPEGIQRLSRRFLKSPEFLKLSADFVGVHEIRHVYYSIPAINREQELLRILNFEDPKTAIIFCNTREETGRVAEFLRKQGFNAEAISSDLGQSDREKVMAETRAGRVKFLVATDVAARGIDIEGLSHVFNYTFPESPEVYIHRTGRTGRAGKHGTAISLIGPTEVGSFYYLKLLYKIKPEERALPSEAEIRSHREGERVLQLRQLLATSGEPTSEWKSLARRLTTALDGESLVAALLARSFGSIEGMPSIPAPKPVAAASARPAGARPSGEREAEAGEARTARDDRPRAERGGPRDRDRERGERDRGRDRDRDRDRGTRRDRPERPAYEARGEARSEGRREGTSSTEAPRGDDGGRRPARADRDRGREGSRPGRGGGTRPDSRAGGGSPGGPGGGEPEKEFWEVWGEEQQAHRRTESGPGPESVGPSAPLATPAPRVSSETGTGLRTDAPREDVPPGTARLYLNLGRKDGASVEQIRDLLRESASVGDIPTIDVMNTHTYLNVASEDADRICAALTGKQLGDRDVVCERARPRRR